MLLVRKSGQGFLTDPALDVLVLGVYVLIQAYQRQYLPAVQADLPVSAVCEVHSEHMLCEAAQLAVALQTQAAHNVQGRLSLPRCKVVEVVEVTVVRSERAENCTAAIARN